MTTSPPTTKKFFHAYSPQPDSFDELVGAESEVRAHSKILASSLDRLGQEEFAHRWQQAQRLVQEHGFAYSGYVTPKDKPRAWDLDPLPLTLAEREWEAVSAALQQRAHLLELVLQDLFGPQRLVKEGLLPPELLFSHPGFLRPYHGQQLPQNRWLHFYAADLARSPAGDWWVLADRTEAPSGLGYAVENRVVVSRMLPDVFQECQVQRLAPFFLAVQDSLHDLAPGHRENPRVVLLSHGPTSSNYFEDAYLARYLGYTLVEGGDLAVRSSQVLLKTLGGLLPVDVILRRQNSAECDPLELRPDSDRGIAGLTQAARAGSVTIINALGSGLVESTAFMAFMPQLCQAMLGEELLIPGVATWWCGDPKGLDHVLKNLRRLTVRPAFRRRGSDGSSYESLSTMTAAELAATIRANPSEYAAQESVVRSSTPVWGSPLRSGHLALRAYLFASGEGHVVMQGALARVSSSHDPLEVSIRRGEGSKDTWILSEGPVDHVTLLDEPGKSIVLRRSGAELPSRAADNLFWLGRQLERAEAAARLLRSAASRMTGETRSHSALEIPVLLRCLADQGQIEPGYAVDEMRSLLPPIAGVLPVSVFDPQQQGCLRSTLDDLFRFGSIVRDRISQDTWRVVHRIDEGFQPAPRGSTNLSDLLVMTDELITELAAFSGIVTESMTRTQAYRFLQLGRRLERSLQVISLVKNCFIPLPEVLGPILETVLEVGDSLMTYRSRYLSNLQLPAVLDLLLTDESNPRSLAYQFVKLAEEVDQLPREQSLPGYTTEQRLAMSLVHSIRMLDIQAVAEFHSLARYEVLEKLAQDWETQLPRLSEAISHRYLVHAVPAHQLANIRPQ